MAVDSILCGPHRAQRMTSALTAAALVIAALCVSVSPVSAQAQAPLQPPQTQSPGGQPPSAGAAPTQTPQALMRRGPASVAEIVADLTDAVVNISTSQSVAVRPGIPMPNAPEGSPFRDFFEDFFNNRNGGRPQRVQSLGSGFVIDPSGYIVTNNHVIEDADEITANFADGSSLTAEVVGIDTKTDLALLKVDPGDRKLKAVAFGDSDALRIGDWVMAIGNPFGLGGSVTLGIVSARNRTIGGPYDDYIQTDAAINRGNSGGPLFDMNGKVVGVNTAIISPSGGSIGIGFAVPATIVSNVVSQLREYGEVRRGWLGVRIQEVTDDIAESLNMPKAEGALVAGVTPDGPAAKAGIKPGDVILVFDGRPVREMRELPRMVAEEPVGKQVRIEILREGTRQTIDATLGRLQEEETAATDGAGEEEESQQPAPPEMTLGLELADLTPDLRRRYGISDDVEGVVVTNVQPGSSAEEKKVQPGDVIVEVSQVEVTTRDEVMARIGDLKQEGRRSALLLLSNGKGELRFVAVRIE